MIPRQRQAGHKSCEEERRAQHGKRQRVTSNAVQSSTQRRAYDQAEAEKGFQWRLEDERIGLNWIGDYDCATYLWVLESFDITYEQNTETKTKYEERQVESDLATITRFFSADLLWTTWLASRASTKSRDRPDLRTKRHKNASYWLSLLDCQY